MCANMSNHTSISKPSTEIERQQLPLKLAWAMTINKSQGLTLKKAWVDLGPSEKSLGMTYVALSRVKKIEDLIVDPMTMDRLQAHKKSCNLKYRLQEEERLDDLAKETLQILRMKERKKKEQNNSRELNLNSST